MNKNNSSNTGAQKTQTIPRKIFIKSTSCKAPFLRHPAREGGKIGIKTAMGKSPSILTGCKKQSFVEEKPLENEVSQEKCSFVSLPTVDKSKEIQVTIEDIDKVSVEKDKKTENPSISQDAIDSLKLKEEKHSADILSDKMKGEGLSEFSVQAEITENSVKSDAEDTEYEIRECVRREIKKQIINAEVELIKSLDLDEETRARKEQEIERMKDFLRNKSNKKEQQATSEIVQPPTTSKPTPAQPTSAMTSQGDVAEAAKISRMVEMSSFGNNIFLASPGCIVAFFLLNPISHIVAAVYRSYARDALKHGDVEAARKDANTAAWWYCGGMIVGVFFWLLMIMLKLN